MKPQPMSGTDMFDHLCDLASDSGYEAGVRLEGGSVYAWSAELRLTVNPNDHNHPDLSTVLYLAGQTTGDEALFNVSALGVETLMPIAARLRDELPMPSKYLGEPPPSRRGLGMA